MFAPTFITTRFTATLAVTLCLAAATPAFAETFESNGRQAEVRYGDLDLSNASDQKTLRKRISVAASQVCVNGNINQYIACRRITLQKAKASVAMTIAKAETQARYADAANIRAIVGN